MHTCMSPPPPLFYFYNIGTHVEKRTTEKTKSDGTVQTVQQKVKINDFKMDFDLTPFISASGTILTLPEPQSGKRPTLREVMEEHVQDENPFKELYMPKVKKKALYRQTRKKSFFSFS